MSLLLADSERSRPSFRDDAAHRSEMRHGGHLPRLHNPARFHAADPWTASASTSGVSPLKTLLKLLPKARDVFAQDCLSGIALGMRILFQGCENGRPLGPHEIPKQVSATASTACGRRTSAPVRCARRTSTARAASDNGRGCLFQHRRAIGLERSDKFNLVGFGIELVQPQGA